MQCSSQPAEDPEAPSSRFQGFLVKPPCHTSLLAISPVDSLAMSTAPAAFSLQRGSPKAAQVRLCSMQPLLR